MQLRTKEIYDAHCASLGGPHHDHIATTFGIARNSILNKLNYFHVVDGLVPDIMHNILEGRLLSYYRHIMCANYVTLIITQAHWSFLFVIC